MLTILPFVSSGILLRPVLPQDASGALMTGIGVGLSTSLFGNIFKIPVFPESWIEYRMSHNRYTKAVLGHMAFFTVYEGLMKLTTKPTKQLDNQRIIASIFAGGIAGLSFNAVSATVASVQLNPSTGLRVLGRSFAFSGLAGLIIEMAQHFVL
jgi:hypothetical protein